MCFYFLQDTVEELVKEREKKGVTIKCKNWQLSAKKKKKNSKLQNTKKKYVQQCKYLCRVIESG